MNDAIAEIVGSATWKMQAVLRTTQYLNHGELLQFYKSKLLSFLEYRTAAIYHACEPTLQRLDNFKEHFLLEFGITAKTSLFVLNLAPLACRRDIAMLGVIHRCVLGKGPPHFQDFFKLASAKASITRRGARRHEREFIEIRNTDCFLKSSPKLLLLLV